MSSPLKTQHNNNKTFDCQHAVRSVNLAHLLSANLQPLRWREVIYYQSQINVLDWALSPCRGAFKHSQLMFQHCFVVTQTTRLDLGAHLQFHLSMKYDFFQFSLQCVWLSSQLYPKTSKRPRASAEPVHLSWRCSSMKPITAV